MAAYFELSLTNSSSSGPIQYPRLSITSKEDFKCFVSLDYVVTGAGSGSVVVDMVASTLVYYDDTAIVLITVSNIPSANSVTLNIDVNGCGVFRTTSIPLIDARKK